VPVDRGERGVDGAVRVDVLVEPEERQSTRATVDKRPSPAVHAGSNPDNDSPRHVHATTYRGIVVSG
jgi:hypothetical protein